MYDLHTQAELFRFPDEPAYLNSLGLSRDGTAMVTAFGNYVRVRDLRPQAYKVPLNHRTPVLGVLSSPDGARFITRSSDEVRVWDPETGETSLVLHTRAQQVHISADGRNLTATCMGAGGTGYESIRNLQNGQLESRRDCTDADGAGSTPLPETGPFEIRVLGGDSAVFLPGGDKPLAWLPERVTSAVWAGRRLCAVTEDGNLIFYELRGGPELPVDPETSVPLS
ncbi:MAG: hypothetical protein E4H36_10480 [Spirochaetales bacterium]|nr:MAG: hypothetical protein E4H36_10480 [Spirochaetales bacterium]